MIGAIALIGASASFPLKATAAGTLTVSPEDGPKISVTPIFEPFRLNNSLSVRDLDKGPAKHLLSGKGGSHILGLTKTQIICEISSATTQIRRNQNGTLTVSLLTISAKMGLTNNSVCIASEILEDSCMTDAVIIHENQHVAVNTDVAGRYPKILLEHLRKMHIQSVTARTEEQASDQIKTTLKTALDDFAKGLTTELTKRHALIDTPEEYARTNTVCGGKIPLMLRKYGYI